MRRLANACLWLAVLAADAIAWAWAIAGVQAALAAGAFLKPLWS